MMDVIIFSLLFSFSCCSISLLSLISLLPSIVFVSDFTLVHVDEVIDELLTKDYSCNIALPRIKKRCSLLYFLFEEKRNPSFRT